MAKLTWGKPLIEIGEVGANGDAPTTWAKLPTPVENTTKLNVEAGEKKEAKIEGGEVIATRTSKNKYTLEFELYQTEEAEKPIEDEDGIIIKNYAVRLTPEDNTLDGFVIDNSSVSVIDTWDSENGAKLKYTFTALKPKTGKLVKPYKATAAVPEG